MDELIDLERRWWEALASTPEQALAFSDEVLGDEVVMLLPGGLLLDDRAQILTSMGGTPWSEFELHEPRAVMLGAEAGVVLYRVEARREGQPPYAALVSSTYRRQGGGWRLAVHQQTPV